MKILDNFASLLFLFSYFWCPTFSVSRRTLDPDPDLFRILWDPDPGWFSGSRASMERLTQKKIQKRVLANYLENLFNGILNIFYRSWPKAPDPYPDPENGSSSLFSKRFSSILLSKKAPIYNKNLILALFSTILQFFWISHNLTQQRSGNLTNLTFKIYVLIHSTIVKL